MTKPLVFATERYTSLADDVIAKGKFETGKIERQVFPDGERYRRISKDCAHRDVVLIGGTVDDHDMLEIYDLGCGIVQQGAHTLTLVIPWFGYQTMERATLPGEIVAAKNRARLMSSIPTAGSGNRAIMIDLHTEGITQYYSGNIRAVHLQARPVIVDAISAIGAKNFVVGAADAGRAQWVEALANDLGVDAAFVFKRRLSGNKTELTAMSADVDGRDVVIYDDMIRTGGSLLAAAEAFKNVGANTIHAVCTHGVFPGDAVTRLRDSGLIASVTCTDTRPGARAHEGDFVRIVSVAPLIAKTLKASFK